MPTSQLVVLQLHASCFFSRQLDTLKPEKKINRLAIKLQMSEETQNNATGPIAELRQMFASDEDVDHSRMRRLAIIITLSISDRRKASTLQEQLEVAISLFENVRDDGRWMLDAMAADLDEAGRLP